MAKREGNRNFVPVAMTDDDLKVLEQLAAAKGHGKSTILRMAFREYVKRQINAA
jgi:predicted transcriptional regulator